MQCDRTKTVKITTHIYTTRIEIHFTLHVHTHMTYIYIHTHMHSPPPPHTHTKEQIHQDVVPIRVSTMGRQHSLREAQQNSTIMRPEREKKNRPLSTIEQQQFKYTALQPDDHTCFQSPPTTTNQSNQFGQGKDLKIPLYKTRSVQTPYGTQVFREVNIEEAIARSQMTQEGAEPDAMTSSSEHQLGGKNNHRHSNVSKRKEFGKKSAVSDF